MKEATKPRLARNASAPCENFLDFEDSNSSAAAARSNAHRIAKLRAR